MISVPLLFFFCIGVFAQSGARRISGTIRDANEPLIGVSILIKGTSVGTVSDMNGKYSIEVPEDKSILLFSYVGYESQEIEATSKRVIDVILLEEASVLEEVVVVGYGTQRRKDLTGAVSSIGGEKLKDIPVLSAAQAISGKLPGVQVTQTDGSPDAEIKIRVRGGGSITQDNSPLYIVDGFPVEDISDIAPSDIESISVLKDASTTAIYGARGANGVILVTTRQGQEGKAVVKYNMYYGLRKVTKYLDLLNPYEFVFWQYEANKGTPSSNYGVFGDYDLYKQMNGKDWQKEVFGNTGTSLYNNLSVSGGSKNVKYNVSVTRNDDKDIMLDTEYNQTNLTSNTSFTVNKYLSFDMNIRLSDYDLEGGARGSLSTILQYRPVKGLSDFVDTDAIDLEDETDLTLLVNPVTQSTNSFRHRKRQNFNYNASMNINFLTDLKYRLEFGYQYKKNLAEEYYGMNTNRAQQYGNMPVASKMNEDGTSLRLANVLTYSKSKIYDHNNVTAMLGQEITQSSLNRITSSARYFPQHASKEDALSMMQLGKADPVSTAYPPDEKVASFFGRLNYDYDGRYLAAFTFRADGSSKFAPGNRWGYFPAASGAWRITEESFMKALNADWLSNLKIRLSYGESGNNRIDNNAWRKTAGISAQNLFLESEDTPSNTILFGSVLYNADLKWETTVTRNLGVDFGFFKHRLSGSVEFYKNTTRDLLVKMNIPSHTGTLSQWRNLGQTSNRGIEMQLEGAIVNTKDIDINASFNIAFNTNRIDRLGDTKSWTVSSNWVSDADAPKDDYLIEEGREVGLMYGYITQGFYSFDDFTYNPNATTPEAAYIVKAGVPDNSSLITPRYFRPGALKLEDIGGGEDGGPDGKIDANDKTVIGNSNPLHTGGFNLNARYKNFDLSVAFNWVYGNDIYNASKLNLTTLRGGKYNRNLLDVMNSNNRWVYFDPATGAIINDPDQLAEMNKDATMWSPGGSTLPLHSWGIEDGSFLRLNNLTIGYSLPKAWLSKIGIQQLRVYATGYNLWLLTNYSGYDPEVDAIRSTPLTPGIDYGSYPRNKTFNFGLNLTF